MISAAIMQRLSALDMPAEAFREVLSIIAEIQAATDTRCEEMQLIDAARRARNANRMRTVRAQNMHGANTVQQEIPPTPPKEIISNLLPFSKDQVRKQERSEIVALGDWPRDYRDQFWAVYPKRVDKSGAMRKLDHVRRSGVVTFANLMAAVGRYAGLKLEPQFTKSPLVWLNKGCWDDEHGATAAEPVPRKGIYVEFSDPAREAWDAYGKSIGKTYPVDKRGGWEFPTRWPPGYGDSNARHPDADQSPRP